MNLKHPIRKYDANALTLYSTNSNFPSFLALSFVHALSSYKPFVLATHTCGPNEMEVALNGDVVMSNLAVFGQRKPPVSFVVSCPESETSPLSGVCADNNGPLAVPVRLVPL